MPRPWSLLSTLVASILSLGLSSCYASDLQLCGQIPEDGCPIGRGGSCTDDACAALYDCVDGAWTVVDRCDEFEPGGGTGGSAGGPGAGGTCELPEIPVPPAVESKCRPDLQQPDCPVAAARTCGACLTECVDFYACSADGWVAVAYCDEAGEVIATRP